MPKENSLIQVLFDWKSKDRISLDVEVQMSAYEQGDFEETGIHTKYGVCVNVPRRRPHKVTWRIFRIRKRPFNKFLKLRRMFDDMKARPIHAEDSVPEEAGC